METMQILLFVLASLVVIITPGQDLLLVMSNAVSQGSRAGVITASGVSLGLLGHSVLAALGLGALLMASAALFTVLKTAGAGYLLFLGVRLFFNRTLRLELSNSLQVSPKKLFLTGAFSNISNPNITIFYFAFLPQFIPNTAIDPTLWLFSLGICFAILTFIVKGPVGYFAGILSLWLRSHPSFLKMLDRISGLMLIGLGVKLALASRTAGN